MPRVTAPIMHSLYKHVHMCIAPTKPRQQNLVGPSGVLAVRGHPLHRLLLRRLHLAGSLEVEAHALEGHWSERLGWTLALRLAAAIAAGARTAQRIAARRRAAREAAQAATATALYRRRHLREVERGPTALAVTDEDQRRHLHEGCALFVGCQGLALQQRLDVCCDDLPLGVELGHANEAFVNIVDADGEDIWACLALEMLVHHDVPSFVQHVRHARKEPCVRAL
mmetsp:Transcript_124635/g.311722  ORF Transcript_124635/g.311722 Transcript_124635/m.311722 type:complete len:225 (-) Transcript_124635:298-972(-)